MKHIIAVGVLLLMTFNGEACRFTIREIGYSPLELEHFSLHLETDTLKDRALVKGFTNLAYAYSINANIKYRVVHQTSQKAKMICRDGEGHIVVEKSVSSLNDVQEFLDELLFSPLQQKLNEQAGDAFAFVVCFLQDDHSSVDEAINKALAKFMNLSPNFAKPVTEPVRILKVTGKEFPRAGLLIKSMGITLPGGESMVAVLYGRGRLSGKPLSGKEITPDALFRQLVVLAADCECGMDLNPILKHAIPVSWNDEVRQEVSDMLKIDVDNPLVLSEMGGILSKERVSDSGEDLSFTPQLIDIDRYFGPRDKTENDSSKEEVPAPVGYRNLWLALGLFVFLVLGVGGWLFLRKR